MKIKNYRILLSIWVLLILFFLGQFLYASLFQTIYPSLLDKLYAITSFLWKYFLAILGMSLFALFQLFDINQKEISKTKEEDLPETVKKKTLSSRNKAIILSICAILALFVIRHVVLVNVYSNYYLIVWNFIYGHIFVSVVSLICLILVLKFSFKKGKTTEKTDEI